MATDSRPVRILLCFRPLRVLLLLTNELITGARMKGKAFWDVTPRNLVGWCKCS